MIKILIIEDDTTIREGCVEYLSSLNYDVEGIECIDSIDNLSQYTYDLLILDVMLPGMNGFDILKEIRQFSDIPILMITALNDDYSQIKLFDLECDDYLAKPFSLVVLGKRVEALLKRCHIQDIWSKEDIQIDFSNQNVLRNDRPIDLKSKELQLLHFLIQHPNQVLSREQIINGIYPIGEAPYDRIVDVYIKNIRKKLSLNCIKTVVGIGYMYEE